MPCKLPNIDLVPVENELRYSGTAWNTQNNRSLPTNSPDSTTKGDSFEFFFDFVVLCDGSGFQTEMRAKLVDRFDSIQALTDFPDILGVNCVVILENTQ